MNHILKSKTFDIFNEDEIREIKKKCGLRRADRFTVIAVTAVKLTEKEYFPNGLPENAAIVTTSSFGPHRTVFSTLDDILDYPEDQILPTGFSHSVHNAMTSYLCTVLGVHGPAMAITNFEDPVDEALQIAGTLIDSEMAPCVLVVAVEERGLLTESAVKLVPERFPVEPKETVSVFLMEKKA